VDDWDKTWPALRCAPRCTATPAHTLHCRPPPAAATHTSHHHHTTTPPHPLPAHTPGGGVGRLVGHYITSVVARRWRSSTCPFSYACPTCLNLPFQPPRAASPIACQFILRHAHCTTLCLCPTLHAHFHTTTPRTHLLHAAAHTHRITRTLHAPHTTAACQLPRGACPFDAALPPHHTRCKTARTWVGHRLRVDL